MNLLLELELPAGCVDACDADFERLDVGFEHAMAVNALPLLHRDPFDRLVIGQAVTEGLAIVTRDERIMSYDVATVPA